MEQLNEFRYMMLKSPYEDAVQKFISSSILALRELEECVQYFSSVQEKMLNDYFSSSIDNLLTSEEQQHIFFKDSYIAEIDQSRNIRKFYPDRTDKLFENVEKFSLILL